MQLSIQATGKHVDVLSYLLAKNPNNIYERNENGHLVRMFFNRFEAEHVDVTFFVTPDPIELSRNNAGQYDITSYINDREFAVSSIFCSLLRTALGTALNGKPKPEYAEWVNHSFPLTISVGPIASALSDDAIRDLFEPLGYKVGFAYSEAGYDFDLTKKQSARMLQLSGVTTLQSALRQLYVLIPVMDNYKHYFIDQKEIEKLKRYGEGWLDDHPERTFILKQALRFKEVYRLVEEKAATKAPKVDRQRLNDLRYEAIIEKVSALPERRVVIDMGAGEGKLASKLGFVSGIETIYAVEPSERERLKALKRYEKTAEDKPFNQPISMFGSLFYVDDRLRGADVLILCEVIEHIDEGRILKMMATLLDTYRPKTLFVTTPNREYNEVYGLDSSYRHPDHRFEWTRSEFRSFCEAQAELFGYTCTFSGIGDSHPTFGEPTQLAEFTRKQVL
ncbi:3' terminal RNA ribose 2'-O-methyltransferase Hen1 [Exiguobacterium sp. SH0S7]|uniref:3' terminal RNA ribose 2'-O-methyltransferase Hen1 n=1 Tax=Exiguobacterium sp. SH0S7 TaxID=2510951 RepID=UPI00103DBBD6|nr:3' terminal RNA ribose 2'-O-methyltransferase Hen1 [Exiguobacterium sp. SH0S7]TCI73335.1 3' terminal RNA ribose 2'-O-methyltransferase Hen1 [Exiguobacterium sp. SH0S7]